jgi:Tfp pilus assembly protein PilO
LKSKSIITFLIVTLAVLLAVNGLLGMRYLRQHQKNEALTAQITEDTKTLAQSPGSLQDLEQKLAAAKTSLADAQSALPKDLNSTRVVNSILKLADACRVKAIPLSTRPWTTENAGKGYHVFRVNMSISGTFPQLTSFLSQMGNGEFKTFIVENLNVVRAPSSSGETVIVTATLSLAVYAQIIPTM